MTRATLSAIAALALIAGAPAQEKPNFAGTWKADNSYNAWTITVQANKMTVTLTVAGNSESTVYMLDGTPAAKKVEGPNGPVEQVYTSAWEGDVLVTTIKTGFGTTLTERRWLEPDGTMRVQNSISIPGKPSPPPGPPMVLKRVEKDRRPPTPPRARADAGNRSSSRTSTR